MTNITNAINMIIENKGIEVNGYFIPPFKLNEEDLIIIHISNDPHFYKTEMLLKNIFSGRVKDKNIIINNSLIFVEPFIESKIRDFFLPTTVERYLKNNANLNSSYATKIFEIKWINKKTKIRELAGTPRKLLSLYATLSKTNNIMFDVAGQDPNGIEKTYEIVKASVKNGGSAILLSCFDDMKNNCTKYIEAKRLI